ncbi:MAG: chromate efflux transporter [Pyrinomonadaceae bacterium]|nr:chromate efflux transporter [Pyrinomonadaceae bacterium]
MPEDYSQIAVRRSVPFAEAFHFWVKLGFISFGGPAGQIAIMHREVVERRRWLSERRFLHALNYCMLLPGPEAQQLAIYIGWLMHRTWGGIIAGVFFVLPSVFILLALSYIYAAYGNLPIIAGVLAGFKPVVVAIVVEAVLKIGQRAIKRRTHLFIAAVSFVAIYFVRVPFPLIVLAAGIAGLAVENFRSESVVPALLPSSNFIKATIIKDGDNTCAASPFLPYAVDDDMPLPAHTLSSHRRALLTLAVGVALWVLPLAAILTWRGFSSLHAHEYLFFTQAALVTFGGAYAVLAYVMQAAVESYGWLTHTQAVDGLALAETTPGPLIMVLQFVGFMAGWNNPAGMNQTLSAVTSALVTTYATFLPCFIFIFLGAPYMEVLRGNKSLSAALSGVTAAVVGVILNLAIVFGAAVIWPRGLNGGAEWFAAVLSILAFVLLYRWKLDVLWVVLVGGLVGCGRALFAG